MASPIPFDTLKFVQELRAAGFDQKQAEAQLNVQYSVIDFLFKKMATKADLEQLGKRLDAELKDVRQDIRSLRDSMTIRLGSIIAAGVTLLAAIRFF